MISFLAYMKFCVKRAHNYFFEKTKQRNNINNNNRQKNMKKKVKTIEPYHEKLNSHHRKNK